MRKALVFSVVLATALALSACAPTVREVEVIKTVEVLVPVPIYCNVNAGPAPTYVDSPEALEAAPNLFEAMKLRIAGRGQSRDRERELEAALEVCRGISIGGDNDASTTTPTRGPVEAQSDPLAGS